MPTYEGIRLKVRGRIIKYLSNFRRKRLKIDNFTIISNNCWGGTIYESYNLPKLTPTVGMFFMAQDYINFLKNLKLFLDTEIEFINPSESKWIDSPITKDNRFGKYPIGRLTIKDNNNNKCSIEIFFLHYKNREEVISKWNRRIERINWDKLIIKFNYQNGCTQKDVEEFDKLDYKNKIFFTVNNKFECRNSFLIKAPKMHNYIRASYEPFGNSKYFNVTDYINKL